MFYEQKNFHTIFIRIRGMHVILVCPNCKKVYQRPSWIRNHFIKTDCKEFKVIPGKIIRQKNIFDFVI